MKLIRSELVENSCLLDLKATDLTSVCHQALQTLVVRGLLPADRLAEVEIALLERESVYSSAIGRSVAVPHIYLDTFTRLAVVVVRLAQPIDLGAPDGYPTQFIFMLVGPPGKAAEHLDTLANVARLMSDEQFAYDALMAQTPEDLIAALDDFIERTTPEHTPPEPQIPEALQYSGRLFGGLVADMRRRYPHYLSDFRDGLTRKSAATILFLTLACLAPAITFGGVLAVETGGQIGVTEMVLASTVCGVVYALCAGQPLIILGGTGPLLIFTAMLFKLCSDLSIPFLPTYAWVGLWTAGFTLILAATDASCLMRYFTRFTDEIFAGLISIIFIYEAVKAVIQVFTDEQLSQASALLSLTLTLGTFYVAITLSQFRRSRYLRPRIREFLADFGPAIAIAVMTIFDVWLHDIDLEKLAVPNTFGTTSGRPWQVGLGDTPQWVWLAAAGPALLCTVLVFLDQNITARLVQSPDQRLAKGTTYHLDLAIVGGLIGASSLFGLPWLVAATVRSLNHLRSLATVETVTLVSGAHRDRVVEVQENRVTGLSIHLLMGASLWLLAVLKAIPIAVLYGLFLYMGVVSLRGNQFFERLSLWLMDPAQYPATYYLKRVPRRTVHQFTLLQLGGLVLLWIVKVSPLAILFPLFIALGLPIRALADRIFPRQDLAALDAEMEVEEETGRRM